ncbi:MAG TPA: radical SAM protein [Myxococcota bacterium]|nr:radical SAM protein [Myxococcota bacterium]
MSLDSRPLSDSDIEGLFSVVGELAQVSYAPPNIYPMSAPVFDAAAGTERGVPPTGPLGIYAHVPYCNYKCTFCFYATRAVPDHAEMSRYVAALERELAAIPPGTPLTQLYVGGGTPSTLPPDLLDRLLESIFARAVRGEQVSTVECSPESVSEGHVRALLRHGIERVSMGVQTNEGPVLEATHRRHDLGRVREAIGLVVGAGLFVNADLIYGLPQQTHAGFRADFEAIASLGVHSITCYNLRVNEHTAIARKIPREARLDLMRVVRWREIARDVAEACGFRQSRWHTFQRRDPATAADAARRFRDDTSWGNQYSVGVSARSRLGATIYRNRKQYGEYLEQIERGESPVDEVRTLDAGERRLRYLTLTLGDGRALERAEYERAFGSRFDDDFATPLRKLLRAGIVEDEGDRVALSARGRLVYDLAIKSFYPEPVLRWMDDRQRLADTARNLRAPAP